MEFWGKVLNAHSIVAFLFESDACDCVIEAAKGCIYFGFFCCVAGFVNGWYSYCDQQCNHSNHNCHFNNGEPGFRISFKLGEFHSLILFSFLVSVKINLVNLKVWIINGRMIVCNQPNFFRTTRASCSGFSLLELLIVLFIIGVLVFIAFPDIDTTIGKSRSIQCESRLEMIRRAKTSYVIDNVASKRVFDCIDLESLPSSEMDAQKRLFRMYFIEPFPFVCPAAPLEEPASYEFVYHLYKDAVCPYCSVEGLDGGVSK